MQESDSQLRMHGISPPLGHLVNLILQEYLDIACTLVKGIAGTILLEKLIKEKVSGLILDGRSTLLNCRLCVHAPLDTLLYTH